MRIPLRPIKSIGAQPSVTEVWGSQPHEAWVTDIADIRNHQGRLYLVVVIDFYSRKVIGWSFNPESKRNWG
jgi:transposase InsO family protein